MIHFKKRYNKKPHPSNSDEVEYVYGGGRGIRTPAGR